MMYKVIKYFTDLTDNRHPYNVGDAYPRKGYEPTPERIAELSSANNRKGVPLIAEVAEKKPAAKATVKEPEKPKQTRKKK